MAVVFQTYYTYFYIIKNTRTGTTPFPQKPLRLTHVKPGDLYDCLHILYFKTHIAFVKCVFIIHFGIHNMCWRSRCCLAGSEAGCQAGISARHHQTDALGRANPCFSLAAPLSFSDAPTPSFLLSVCHTHANK